MSFLEVKIGNEMRKMDARIVEDVSLLKILHE
jgi:hypothetical protein